MAQHIYLQPTKDLLMSLIAKYGNEQKVIVFINKRHIKLSLKRACGIKDMKYLVIPSQIEQLEDLMDTLRSSMGCQWDREQTHKTLLPYLIEESHEFCDAVAKGEYDKIKEELGDILLQVVFHSQIAKENNHFSLDDCAKSIKDKLIFRHPHVFKNRGQQNKEDVELIWKAQKDKENKADSTFDGLPPIIRIEKNVGKLKKRNNIRDLDKNIHEELCSIFIEKNPLDNNLGEILLKLVIYGKIRGINTTYELLKSIQKWEKTL